MPHDKLRVALYGRCSTNETKQDVETQFMQLRRSCEHKPWQVVKEYVDYESGRKGREKRTEFDAMLEAASRGEHDLIYFWRLDRFSREGIKKTIQYLELLNGWGVKFKSHQEPYLDTENELVSHMLIAILSYFAQQEAVKISENTKLGLERARAKGKKLGRPGLPEATKAQILKTFKDLNSKRGTAKKLGLPESTVRKVIGKWR